MTKYNAQSLNRLRGFNDNVIICGFDNYSFSPTNVPEMQAIANQTAKTFGLPSINDGIIPFDVAEVDPTMRMVHSELGALFNLVGSSRSYLHQEGSGQWIFAVPNGCLINFCDVAPVGESEDDYTIVFTFSEQKLRAKLREYLVR